MSRIRSIKPSFFIDEDLAELSPLTDFCSLACGRWRTVRAGWKTDQNESAPNFTPTTMAILTPCYRLFMITGLSSATLLMAFG